MMRRALSISLLLLCMGAVACSKKGASSGSSGTSKSGSEKKGGGGSSGAGGGQRGGAQSGNQSEDQSKGSQEQGGPQASDTVKIPPEDQQRAAIRVEAVEVRSEPRMLMVAGQVQMDEQYTSHVGAIADGRITAVAVLPGAIVHRGETLATLHSHSVHETVGALVQAFAAVERQQSALTFAEQARDRYTHLYSIQAASLEESQRAKDEVQQATNMLTDAQANVHMEKEHLSELLQVSPDSLTRSNLYDRELIPVRAVGEGTVIARNVTVGQVVQTGYETFTVSNLSTVWVSAAVNERDLSLIHNGATVQVTTQGYPEQIFPGRVTMVGSTLDPQTRTVPVRITVPNPGTRLRPGMFASAQIAEPATRLSVFVPEIAMQDINGLQVVFVTTDGSMFKAQAVKIGTRDRGRAEIIDGLKPGDHIVTAGAFMVKSEMLKGTMGEG